MAGAPEPEGLSAYPGFYRGVANVALECGGVLSRAFARVAPAAPRSR